MVSLAKNALSAIIQPGIKYFDYKNYLATANVVNCDITDGEWITYDNRETRANMQPVLNSVWFAKMKASCKHITVTHRDKWFVDKYILSTGFLGLKCTVDTIAFIRQFIYSKQFEIIKDMLSHGNTQQAVNNDDLQNIKFAEPDKLTLQMFARLLNPIISSITIEIENNQNLIEIRNSILPLLMNGQVVVR